MSRALPDAKAGRGLYETMLAQSHEARWYLHPDGALVTVDTVLRPTREEMIAQTMRIQHQVCRGRAGLTTEPPFYPTREQAEQLLGGYQ